MQSKRSCDLSIHTAFVVVVSESDVVSEGNRLSKMRSVERFFELCRKGSAYFSNERSPKGGWDIQPNGFASRVVESSGSRFKTFGFYMPESDSIWHVHTYLVIPNHELREAS